MNDFLTVLVKVSFLALVFIGLLSVALGVVIYFFPNLLFLILRWGSVVVFGIGGGVLVVGALYGYVTVKRTML